MVRDVPHYGVEYYFALLFLGSAHSRDVALVLLGHCWLSGANLSLC